MGCFLWVGIQLFLMFLVEKMKNILSFFILTKKIYEVKDEKELSLIKKLESDMRWYDNELKDYLSKGYTLV